jgi:hypothetical protein
MRMIATMADRVLSLVVPKTTAAAICCTPEPRTVTCGCIGGWEYAKHCTNNCACKAQCQPCYKISPAVGCP